MKIDARAGIKLPIVLATLASGLIASQQLVLAEGFGINQAADSMMQGTDATLEITPNAPLGNNTAPAATPDVQTANSPLDPADNSSGGQAQKTSSTPAVNPLAGHVMKAQAGLRDIQDCTKKMKRRSLDFMGELTRLNLLWGHPPTAGNSSDILWGGSLTKAEVFSQYRDLPSLVFTAPMYAKFFSYSLPPRKKYLLVYTRELGELVNLMLAEIVDTELPSDKQNQLAAPWMELNKLAKDVENQYIKEYNLVESTTDERLQKNIRDDRAVFGEPVYAIYADMGKMDDVLKDMDKIVREKDNSHALSQRE